MFAGAEAESGEPQAEAAVEKPVHIPATKVRKTFVHGDMQSAAGRAQLLLVFLRCRDWPKRCPDASFLPLSVPVARYPDFLSPSP